MTTAQSNILFKVFTEHSLVKNVRFAPYAHSEWILPQNIRIQRANLLYKRSPRYIQHNSITKLVETASCREFCASKMEIKKFVLIGFGKKLVEIGPNMETYVYWTNIFFLFSSYGVDDEQHNGKMLF